jgi:hypothetical protein
MIHVGNTGTYRIKGLERAHQRPDRKHLDFDAAAGRGADRLRETNRAGVKAREPVRSVGHHLQLPDSLRDRRRGEGHGRAGGQ